jgi:hypothetical protein
MAIMNTEEHSGDVETHVLIFALALILGMIGAFFVGFFALFAAAMGADMDLGLLWVANYMLTGGSAGASVVGVLTLCCEVNLGRGFSVVFAICLACLTGTLLHGILGTYGLHYDDDVFTGAWSAWIVAIGVFGGAFLADSIRGYYYRWSGILAAAGAGLMLLIGALTLSRTRGAEYAVMMFIFALLGGICGAMVGAICNRAAGEQSTIDSEKLPRNNNEA